MARKFLNLFVQLQTVCGGEGGPIKVHSVVAEEGANVE